MATEIQVVKQQTVKDIIASQLQYLVPAKTERDVILATAYALMQNPDIKRCTPQSIVIAVTNAVDIGFSLSPIDGEVAFIPRANSDTGQVQLIMQPMVRGYVNLARRLGDWEMQAILVYTCDTLKMKKVCEDGFYIDQIDEYQPNLEVQEAHAGNQKWAIDNLRGVICTARRYAKTPKQEIITTPLITKAVIENHRMRSENQKSTTPTGAWLTVVRELHEELAINYAYWRVAD